ncbi:uncharacterized protein LOC135211020 [Macrobrachium nipponense]|uniref:uncharacterized protein LOC135211020 n=1 Tax=Macrobrachium nipponense TaxID=159736 RepID=UPI0030C7D97D
MTRSSHSTLGSMGNPIQLWNKSELEALCNHIEKVLENFQPPPAKVAPILGKHLEGKGAITFQALPAHEQGDLTHVKAFKITPDRKDGTVLIRWTTPCESWGSSMKEVVVEYCKGQHEKVSSCETTSVRGLIATSASDCLNDVILSGLSPATKYTVWIFLGSSQELSSQRSRRRVFTTQMTKEMRRLETWTIIFVSIGCLTFVAAIVALGRAVAWKAMEIIKDWETQPQLPAAIADCVGKYQGDLGRMNNDLFSILASGSDFGKEQRASEMITDEDQTRNLAPAKSGGKSFETSTPVSDEILTVIQEGRRSHNRQWSSLDNLSPGRCYQIQASYHQAEMSKSSLECVMPCLMGNRARPCICHHQFIGESTCLLMSDHLEKYEYVNPFEVRAMKTNYNMKSNCRGLNISLKNDCFGSTSRPSAIQRNLHNKEDVVLVSSETSKQAAAVSHFSHGYLTLRELSTFQPMRKLEQEISEDDAKRYPVKEPDATEEDFIPKGYCRLDSFFPIIS